MRWTLTLLLLVLAPLSFARQRAVRHPSPLQIPAVDTIAAEAIARGVPGLVIGVRKGTMTYTKAWGDFDVEAHVPEHTSTIHQIASVSKQFTAAAIMRLVEQGKVKLDDRASLWVTELDARFDGVTIERLLSHTSGLLEYDDTITEDPYTPKTQQQLLAAVRPPFLPFGTRFYYSNMGYFLLALVIERASNKTYEQFLRDEFFRPFGLDDTSVCGSNGPVPEGYFREDGKERVRTPPYHMTIFLGAGSLCSTAADLLDWNNALANGMAITPQSYAKMTTVVEPTPPHTYAFGIVNDRLDGRHRIWHGGFLPGFTSHLSWFPEEKLTIAVLVNLSDVDRSDASAIAVAVARAMK